MDCCGIPAAGFDADGCGERDMMRHIARCGVRIPCRGLDSVSGFADRVTALRSRWPRLAAGRHCCEPRIGSVMSNTTRAARSGRTGWRNCRETTLISDMTSVAADCPTGRRHPRPSRLDRGFRSRRCGTGPEEIPAIRNVTGGAIAIAYAARYPEKVSHLVLFGAYARGALRRNITDQQREEAETLVKLIQLGWGRDNPAFRQVFTSQFIPDGTREQHQHFNDLERISASPENAVAIVETAVSARRQRGSGEPARSDAGDAFAQ